MENNRENKTDLDNFVTNTISANDEDLGNSSHCGFLSDIQSLRQQKGKYLTKTFCTSLEDISQKMNEAIIKQNYRNKLTAAHKPQAPEKMSDDAVELCLECIEMYLQKLPSSNNCVSPDFLDLDCQETQILEHVSEDLCTLASYIKYTLDVN